MGLRKCSFLIYKPKALSLHTRGVWVRQFHPKSWEHVFSPLDGLGMPESPFSGIRLEPDLKWVTGHRSILVKWCQKMGLRKCCFLIYKSNALSLHTRGVWVRQFSLNSWEQVLPPLDGLGMPESPFSEIGLEPDLTWETGHRSILVNWC